MARWSVFLTGEWLGQVEFPELIIKHAWRPSSPTTRSATRPTSASWRKRKPTCTGSPSTWSGSTDQEAATLTRWSSYSCFRGTFGKPSPKRRTISSAPTWRSSGRRSWSRTGIYRRSSTHPTLPLSWSRNRSATRKGRRNADLLIRPKF